MLLFVEGFDWAAGSGASDLTTYGKWDTQLNVAFATAASRFGTGQYLFQVDRMGFVKRDIGQNLGSGVIGFAFSTNTTSWKGSLCLLWDGATRQCGVLLNASGTVSVYRDTESNILGTSTWTIAANTWYYIELKFRVANSVSAGDVQVYVDGNSVLSIAATSDTQNSGNAYATSYNLGGNLSVSSPGDSQMRYDDHYLCDLTGSLNNAPIGNCRVNTILPTGNGNISNFLNQGGNSTNNFSAVDDVSPNNDTDYVESATPTNKDTYAFADLPASTNTVYGVATNLVAKKTDTSTREICSVVRISSTDYDGTTFPALTTTYKNYQRIAEQSPATVATWTASEINGSEFGMKVVT